MRKVTLGGKELELRASPLALLFYRQAFGKDLIADLVSLQSLQGLAKGDFSGLDTVLLLQITYAMHRAAKPGTNVPGFEQWLGELEYIDFGDTDWILGVAEEATEGFFRSAGSAAPPATKSKKK